MSIPSYPWLVPPPLLTVPAILLLEIADNIDTDADIKMPALTLPWYRLLSPLSLPNWSLPGPSLSLSPLPLE